MTNPGLRPQKSNKEQQRAIPRKQNAVQDPDVDQISHLLTEPPIAPKSADGGISITRGSPAVTRSDDMGALTANVTIPDHLPELSLRIQALIEFLRAQTF